MAVTDLHTFGWLKEAELKPRLEAILGERLVKTAQRYDSIDFVSRSYVVELKARRKERIDEKTKAIIPVDSNSYVSWLLPVRKVEAAQLAGHRRGVFFYYYEGDGTLWQCWEDEVDWKLVYSAVPKYHHEEHYYVDKDLWAQVS